MGSHLGDLRADATAAFGAAIDAVRPERLIPAAVRVSSGRVEVLGRPLPAVTGRRLLVAVGKAAPGLASAWLEVLPGWADEVVVLAPQKVAVAPSLARAATVLRGSHPYPDGDGERAARALLERAAGLGGNDLLMLLLSGGGSALLAAPADDLTLEEVQTTTRLLLEAGAPIGSLNTVRRQLLAAAGGGLARAASPASVETLILSDVIGDTLADIASGPTVPSPTGRADGLAVLRRYGLQERVPERVVRVLQASGGDRSRHSGDRARRSHAAILANNATATGAAAHALRQRSFDVVTPQRPLAGEARERGRQLGGLAVACRPRGPTAVILGGETTVTVRGPGRGGRSQELALAAALELEGGRACVLLAGGTDGVDGASDNAGAVVDPGSAARMRAAGVEPCAALAANDSATAVAASGDVLVTGPTGTNVCDLVVLLLAPSSS